MLGEYGKRADEISCRRRTTCVRDQKPPTVSTIITCLFGTYVIATAGIELTQGSALVDSNCHITQLVTSTLCLGPLGFIQVCQHGRIMVRSIWCLSDRVQVDQFLVNRPASLVLPSKG